MRHNQIFCCLVQSEIGGKVDTGDCFLDIVFLLDASGSVGPGNWAIQVDFAANLAKRYDIGQDATRVGVALFSVESVSPNSHNLKFYFLILLL